MIKDALIFAPIDGVTDAPFRSAIMKSFPEWDYYFTDFFRVPTTYKITTKEILSTFGPSIYSDESLRKKTVFQILSSFKSNSEVVAKITSDLQITWLDLNLGCPSKTVFNHRGGSFLLGNLKELRSIVEKIRKNYLFFFSVKMRIGVNDDLDFFETIKILEGEGVDLITVHPRTRAQFYQGTSDWNYIKLAVTKVNIPIVGNGDIKNSNDIHRMNSITNCHGIMIGRAAIKNPLLAKNYHQKEENHLSIQQIITLLEEIKFSYFALDLSSDQTLQRLKLLLKTWGGNLCQQTISDLLKTTDLLIFETLLKKLGNF